ncbi:MAG TPA: glycoside hydrolase family 3 N-terminal domain-containing protein, partial [Deinococcales bacterium]|nr:glycoside hydrolase family 3 N-terminal domain-containing protein [Deinococcales bacterium]
MPRDLEQLVDSLTLEERVSLLAGQDSWSVNAIPAKGVPYLRVSDGPNGARGSEFMNGAGASAFPAGVSLASSWDLGLLEEVGRALAGEALSKGARVLLAPTVNLHRTPLNGRTFEAYSEDPFLTGKLAVAYVKGLQGLGVAATVKHFVGNESEFERMSISSDIGERALRELYLRPFEMAVKDGDAWAIMTAYNKVNGTFAGENPWTLGVLRGEWGFDGLVMSDWFGTHSVVEAANAGLDLEMPGPTQWRGERLVRAVREGK